MQWECEYENRVAGGNAVYERLMQAAVRGKRFFKEMIG